VAFYTTGTHLISGGRDGRIILWNLDTEKSTRQYSLPAGEVRSLAMMPDGIRFLSGDSTGLVRVWELASGREVMQFKAQKTAVNALAISPLGDRVLSCGNDGTLVLFDLENKRAIAGWSSSGSTTRGTSVAFSAGGTRALSTDSAGGVRLWSCEDNQLLNSYSGHTRAVLCSAFFPNGVVALTGSADESVRLWRMPSPATLEKKKMAEVADHAQRTAEKFARFAGRMTLGREYLDQKKLDEALAEFNAAAAGVDRAALEFELASDAATKVKAVLQKKTDYRELCESGKKAAEQEDYERAMHDFDLAAAIFPDRPEADEGHKKAAAAWQLKQALDESDVNCQLGFAANAPSRGALHKAKDFAFLLVREVPPMALVTTPLAWTIEVDTAVDFPDVGAKLQVRLLRVGTKQPIAVVEHPFVPGTRHQLFLGEAPPPSGGWVKSGYELSTSLIIADRTQSLGDSLTFDIGLLHWRQKSFEVTPEAVHKGNYSLATEFQVEKGDALSIEAQGTVAPAPVQFYRELMADKKIADPVPSRPTGLTWLSDDMRLSKYTAVDVNWNFAALLVRVGGQGWVPYYEDVPPQVLPASGKLELSINSIVRTKLSQNKGLETVASKDQTYWRANSGKYEVTLHHGRFDFPRSPPLGARALLLERFSQ
jgi:tetratricopeptide (TPR) repeat protein